MGFLKKLLKRVTSAGLALLTAVTVLPASVGTAFAASESTLSSVTAKYIDAADGKEIASRETYRVTHEEKRRRRSTAIRMPATRSASSTSIPTKT